MSKVDPFVADLASQLWARSSSNYTRKQDIIPTSGKLIAEEDIAHLIQAVSDGVFTASKYSDLFSRQLSDYTGIRHCSLVNSGSSANLLAISALCSPSLGKGKHLQRGDKVLCVAAAFATSIFPILQNGLIPVFVDINLEDLNINLDQAEDVLVKTEGIRAVFVAHTLGIPFDFKAVRSLCDRHNLFLIEDCCDALGSTIGTEHVGSHADISTLSFYPAHHITSAEGGAVLTNNALLKRVVDSLRDWGRDCWCIGGQDNSCGKRFAWKFPGLPAGYDHKFIFTEVGYNLKLTEFQAALGYSQSLKIDQFRKIRHDNHTYLSSLVFRHKILHDMIIQHKPFSDRCSPSWFGFPITLTKKASEIISMLDLGNYLNEQGVMTRPIFSGNITMHPALQFHPYEIAHSLKVTNYIMSNTLWVGVSQQLSLPDMEKIFSTLKSYFDQVFSK